MSLEITLYTKNATKTGLINFLCSGGFKKARHFIEEMNTPERIHFIWFEYNNFESSTGVEATIIKLSIEEKQKYSCSDWILHTRTRSTASFEDKLKQNNIIKLARKQFGGSFFNDWYGTNKYTNLNDYKKYNPLEKAISNVANNSFEKLDQITDCLRGYRNGLSENIAAVEHPKIRALLVRNDPSIILYNSLIPFLVSVLEYFFSQCFVNYIKYNELAKNRLKEENIKIHLSEVLNVLSNENSIEQIVTKLYNFQNIESINKAFNKYVSIDVKNALYQKKKINGRTFLLLKKIEEILEVRHRFVHELDIDYSLSKEIYLDYVTTIEKTIQVMIVEFNKQGLTIKIDY